MTETQKHQERYAFLRDRISCGWFHVAGVLDDGTVKAISGDTGIFIFPGYKFKAVDALITNFHLPESTLLMLISALYNREGIMKAYDVAVKERYRFFSFGDAMFIE